MNEFDLRKFLYSNPLMEKKEDSKKGNKEEQKRAEGAIKDDEKHAKKLKKDAEFQKEKLAQLKKDYDRDVKKVKSGAVKEAQGYDDREDESLGARRGAEKGKKQSMKDRRDDSYGKFGKRDAEKKGKNKINKEEMSKSYSEDGDMKKEEMEGKKKLTKEGLKGMIRERIASILNEEDKDIAEGAKYYEDKIKEDEQFVGNDINANKLLNILTEYLPTSHYHQDKTLSYDEALNMVAEFVKFTGMDSTGEDFLNHIMDTEGPIKEAEEVEIKDDTEIDIDDESVESDIDVKTSIPGTDADIDAVLGLLTKASQEADAFSDDPELKTQIGNTITYFTRNHIAKTS